MESIVCRNCIPDQYTEDELKRMRGYWDVDYTDYDFMEGVAKCRNCGFKRPFKHRKPKVTGKPNKSQQRAIDNIREFFKDGYYEDWRNGKGWKYRYPELYKFEVEPTKHGGFWVEVRTTGDWRTDDGAHIHIGPRGAIEVWSTYGIHNDGHQKHIAKMLGGKVK